MHEHALTPGRIAILSPFFFPEPISTGKVNTFLAMDMVERGWKVIAICSHPLYPDWRPHPTTETLPGMRFLRGGAFMRYSARAVVRRALLEVWFTFHAVISVMRVRRQISIALYVIPPSLFVLFVHLLLPKRVRRVAVIHDLQGVYAQRKQSPLGDFLTRGIHAVEERAFRSADTCIFFSHDIAAVARKSYGLTASQIRIQYPFVTMNETDPVTDELENILPSGVKHVVYAGAMGEKQNSDQLVAFLKKAAEEIPDAEFHIFSAGPKFEQWRDNIGTAVPHLHFHELLPERQLAELYARSDIQIVPQALGTEVGSLPSKLPNLIAKGVYILALCSLESEVCDLLRQTGTATFVGSWESDLFVSGVRSALAAAAGETAEVRRKRSAEVLAKFRVENLTSLVVGEN
jgi:glycosyltransferase involved in cell wall biosynthesis